MLIEQILYMNLDRRPDRNEWFLENMETAGVPMEIVERIPAKDWQDYNSHNDLFLAMQADGFAANIADAGAVAFPKFRGHIAHVWTVSRVLRQIFNDRKVTLVMHDDVSIRSWKDLISSLSVLDVKNRDPFHVVHLYYEGPDEHLSFADALEMGLEPYYFSMPCEKDVRWCYGAGPANDPAVIYSWLGADRVLSLIQGGFETLNPVETVLSNHFHNFLSFRPADPNRFVYFSKFSSQSDIRDNQNPDMLDRSKISYD